MLLDIEHLRKEYSGYALGKKDVHPDPALQFKAWFEEATRAQVPEPNAMTLATCSATGVPSARIVLLKGFEADGFVFFTNYNSKKGRELAENPNAALVFLWHELQRQVRIQGTVEKVSPAESTEYFQSRPRGSQIGAWVSSQSEVIPNRQKMEEEVSRLEQQYAGQEALPRPLHWGGYRLRPEQVEFWQGRPNRLHDRILYSRRQHGWEIGRLAP